MPPNEAIRSPEHEFFETLFREYYPQLLRYATTILGAHGAKYISTSGRAEEVVQETFQLAWKKRDELMKLERPMGWLCLAVVRKTQEALRDDRRWIEHLGLLNTQLWHDSEEALYDELQQVLTTEEYDLLRKLYLEGWSYRELCEEFGEKKSTLAMRINRSKKKIQDFFENF